MNPLRSFWVVDQVNLQGTSSQFTHIWGRLCRCVEQLRTVQQHSSFDFNAWTVSFISRKIAFRSSKFNNNVVLLSAWPPAEIVPKGRNADHLGGQYHRACLSYGWHKPLVRHRDGRTGSSRTTGYRTQPQLTITQVNRFFFQCNTGEKFPGWEWK